MVKLSLLEMQDIEYGILCCIADVCERNHLRYSLCGGSLLGAVRHKGFIPWDDDIDIGMPRTDYEKFLKLQSQLPKYYRISSPYNDKNNFNAYSKVYDMRTKLIESPQDKKISRHVYVDIFPIDGLPGGGYPASQDNHRKKVKRRFLILYAARIAKYKAKDSKGVRRVFWQFIDKMGFFKFDLARIVDRAATKYSFDSSKYAANIVAGYGSREIMPKVVYEFCNQVTFRDREFMAFRMPEYYLTNLYGDFMRLPPVKDRQRHDNVAYRL